MKILEKEYKNKRIIEETQKYYKSGMIEKEYNKNFEEWINSEK